MTNPQCIHIPDGSVVVSGELFDQACAAIAERDKLVAENERLRGNLSLAEEGLANYALEVERLRNIVTGCPVCSELERNIQPSHEPCEPRAQPLEAETRAATSRKVPSTEDVGRPPPTEGASRDASSSSPPEIERLTRISLAARALLKYLDDHDWGLIPEGQTANTLRDLLDGGCHGS